MTSNTTSTSNIFIKPLSIDLLQQLLHLVANEEKNAYHYNFETFNRAYMFYYNNLRETLHKLEPYYYKAKAIQYINLEHITFKSVATILRQICKHLKIPFETQRIYEFGECKTVHIISHI